MDVGRKLIFNDFFIVIFIWLVNVFNDDEKLVIWKFDRIFLFKEDFDFVYDCFIVEVFLFKVNGFLDKIVWEVDEYKV